jgi:hypothetical protein
MGTMMSAEIARQYNINNNNQNINRMILLDPPNYYPLYTGFNEFRVDDRTGNVGNQIDYYNRPLALNNLIPQAQVVQC